MYHPLESGSCTALSRSLHTIRAGQRASPDENDNSVIGQRRSTSTAFRRCLAIFSEHMDEYRTRVRLYAGVVIVALVVLGLRCLQLQVVSADAYWGVAQGNAVREQRVEPARGAIYDRSGTLLVDNEPTYTIMLTPRYFDASKAGLLADVLSVPDSTVHRKLDEARAWSAFRPSRSFREVSFETFGRVQEHLYRLPGVSYEVEQRRRYHTDARPTHALGYIREIEIGRASCRERVFPVV